MILTENNYISFAMHNYNNPQCRSVAEFEDDLNRIKYLKRLVGRYLRTGVLRDRLILNHLIVFCNVFGIEAAQQILFFKLCEEMQPVLKSCLVFLKSYPDPEDGVDIDIKVLELLETI